MDYEHYQNKLLAMYKHIPLGLILKLVEVYKWDFELFGYDYQPFIDQAKNLENTK